MKTLKTLSKTQVNKISLSELEKHIQRFIVKAQNYVDFINTTIDNKSQD